MRKKVWLHEDEIDFNGIYLCPMVRSDTKYPDEVSDLIEVKITKYPLGGGYDIIPLVAGYDKKFFYDNYLAFLLYTKYIYKKA